MSVKCCEKPAKYGQPWSREDLDYLSDTYGLISNEEIAKHLQRSEISIGDTGHQKLHLHLTDNFYTATELARLLGFKADNVIVKYACKGWMKGSRKLCGKRWYWCFTEDDIKECLCQRPWLADVSLNSAYFPLVPDAWVKRKPWRLMPQHYFRSIIREEWERDPWCTPKQAAPLLGVTHGSVLKYINRGWLPVDIQKPSGSLPYIIRRSTIDAFLKNDTAAQRRFATIASRPISTRNGLKKRGFPTRVGMVWDLVCPSCGQEVKIMAPPEMIGLEVREKFITVYINGTCSHGAEVELTLPP